jgi:CheY-like chemotaxis protein
MQVPDEFVHQVRNALTHLYDPDVLRTHPLLVRLGLEQKTSPHAALRDTLIAAIEALQPAVAVPLDSREWRVYKLLQLRYIQQIEQGQVAYQLGVGVRHLRREQRAAIEMLAAALFSTALPEPLAQPPSTPALQSWEAELSWLKAGDAEISSSLAEVLQTAIKLVAPLAEKRAVLLVLEPCSELGPVAVLPAALRQCLVSLTTYVISQAAGGVIRFVLEREPEDVRLSIHVDNPIDHPRTSAAEDAGLRAARSLLGDLENRLMVMQGEGTLIVTLRLPLLDVHNVLMIDDNVEVAQLFQRYTYGTHFRIQHAAASEDIYAVVHEQNICLILLDVMMPGNDGWEILGALKSHPATSDIPVVVCTVLPERDLALALGAADFLAKPVLRPDLLAVLQRVLTRDR